VVMNLPQIPHFSHIFPASTSRAGWQQPCGYLPCGCSPRPTVLVVHTADTASHAHRVLARDMPITGLSNPAAPGPANTGQQSRTTTGPLRRAHLTYAGRTRSHSLRYGDCPNGGGGIEWPI